MKIKLLITGGTIDGLEYTEEDQRPTDHETLIPQLLAEVRSTADINVEVLMNKDSRFVTDEDREVIAQKCIVVPEERIVITHGTITMADTASFLVGKAINKTIVLLGAMVPANQEKSDALFNLGGAIIASQTLPIGVYVVMNGRVFEGDKVAKNTGKGIFESTE